jgi:hypothetical protein
MRAADDFVAIRTRLEQLKREREPRPARKPDDEPIDADRPVERRKPLFVVRGRME